VKRITLREISRVRNPRGIAIVGRESPIEVARRPGLAKHTTQLWSAQLSRSAGTLLRLKRKDRKALTSQRRRLTVSKGTADRRIARSHRSNAAID
jgi:hypothetical protein